MIGTRWESWSGTEGIQWSFTDTPCPHRPLTDYNYWSLTDAPSLLQTSSAINHPRPLAGWQACQHKGLITWHCDQPRHGQASNYGDHWHTYASCWVVVVVLGSFIRVLVKAVSRNSCDALLLRNIFLPSLPSCRDRSFWCCTSCCYLTQFRNLDPIFQSWKGICQSHSPMTWIIIACDFFPVSQSVVKVLLKMVKWRVFTMLALMTFLPLAKCCGAINSVGSGISQRRHASLLLFKFFCR